MKQGEIWNVYFDPVKGSEQAGNRPAVIISGDTLNKNLTLVIVCPLTSVIHNYKGHPILTPTSSNGLSNTSEVLVFQVRALSKERFKKKLGKIKRQELQQVKDTLNDILKY